MKAALEVKQDGTKITGTCDMGHMGSMALAGHRGRQAHFLRHRNGGRPEVVFSGVINGTKMTGTTDPEGGEWTASRV